MNKNGSAIIFVVTITAVIMLLLINASNIVLCSTSIALKRQQYEQHFRAVQGLVTVVCNICKEHWNLLTHNAPYQWVTEFSTWPCAQESADYQGRAIVTIENESRMQIVVSLLDATKVPVSTVRCILECTDPNKIMIHSWTTDDTV